MANFLKTAIAYPGITSDHSIIFIHLTNSLVKRGRGFWKLNATLLYDLEYVKSVTELIDNLKASTVDMEDKQLRWEYIKMEVRDVTLQYSRQKSKAKKEFKLKLEKDLYNLQNDIHDGMSETNVKNYHFIKEELDKIEELETKGAI